VPTIDAVVLGVIVPIPTRLLVELIKSVFVSTLRLFGIARVSALNVRVSVEALPRVVLPSVLKLPSTSRALRILVVPVAAAMIREVAAPQRLSVVAVAFTRLKVVAVVVISHPFTAISPVFVWFPVTASVPPRVEAPVPTVKVFEPVTEVAPLREIAPVPVEKVPPPI
jgi:hypothetical protein